MKKIFILLFVAIVTFANSTYSNALTITTPTPGRKFSPGDKVVVRVNTEINEDILGVFIFTYKLGYSTIAMMPPYVLEFVIDETFTGKDKIVASGKLSNGKMIETEVEFEVVLPLSIKLENLTIDPSSLFLQKLPINSDPNKIIIYGTEHIGVAGIYSDGYKRDISSASSGTIYRSSDESIVAVDSEGLATAKNAGRAKIFISNSGKEISVDAIVKEVSN
jgi:hypothetical protein